MAYQTLSEFNATTPDSLLVYANTIFPGFIPLVLFVFYLILLLGIFFSQKRFTGRGNPSVSCAVAGFVTFLLAVSMTLIEGLMNGLTLAIVFVVMAFGVLWLLLSRETF